MRQISKYEVNPRNGYYALDLYQFIDGEHTMVKMVDSFRTRKQAELICCEMNDLVAPINQVLFRAAITLEAAIDRQMTSIYYPKTRKEAEEYLRRYSQELFEHEQL